MKAPTTRRASADTAADLLLALLTRCGGYLTDTQVDALTRRRHADGDTAALNILLGQLATVPNDYSLPLDLLDRAQDVCNLWAECVYRHNAGDTRRAA